MHGRLHVCCGTALQTIQPPRYQPGEQRYKFRVHVFVIVGNAQNQNSVVCKGTLQPAPHPVAVLLLHTDCHVGPFQQVAGQGCQGVSFSACRGHLPAGIIPEDGLGSRTA